MKHEQWMVRTKELFISRPMSQEDLVRRIEKGELTPLDEICPANGYWFGLHETVEVRKHLGDIDLSKLSGGIEIEITSSTETSTIKKTLILEVPKSWGGGVPEQKTVLPSNLLQPAQNPFDPKFQQKPISIHAEELEADWVPAIIFGIIFGVVLIFLWMHSD